jgi:hypothetical protein
LAINSPSEEGKSHTLSKVYEKFPESDVIIVQGMTEKALVHDTGTLVIKNENDEYEPIEDRILKLDEEIDDLENQLSHATAADLRSTIRSTVTERKQQKRELLKDARKLIDLQHKILIFLDTPNPRLFEAIMPLLSHDKFESEYIYVDTHNGIKTKKNVLRGWPAVIFAQAIDYSHYQRFPELQRRFIVANPKMTADKYKAAIELTSIKFGMPDFVYQAEVVSDSEKKLAQDLILALKDQIADVAAKYNPGKQNILIPFNDPISEALPTQKAFDMTIANRFFTFLSLLPIINFHKRPRIVCRKEGELILQKIPIATFDDLKEAMFLMEYANGVRPYILEWYNEVFIPSFQAKTEPASNEKTVESRIALTTEELAEVTYAIQKKKMSTKQILENYVKPLINQAYIDSADSKLDGRRQIYYPVLAVKQRKLFDLTQSNNFSQDFRIPVSRSDAFPNKQYITSKIQGLSKYSSDNKVFRFENENGDEKTAEDIAQTYYPEPDKYFELILVPPSDEYPTEPKMSPVSQTEPEKYSISTQSNTFEPEKTPEAAQEIKDGLILCPYPKCLARYSATEFIINHSIRSHANYPITAELQKLGYGV